MLKVYLASRFSRQSELRGHAADLRREGIACTSRWLTGVHNWSGTADQHIPHAEQARFAQDDLDDIDQANVLVVFGDPPGNTGARGGACVEVGYALGMGIPVIVVGFRQNVFYCLPQIIYCETWDAARVYVAGLTLGSSGELAA